jgi:HAD superfamily hydrolase (TIGR01509 family)
MSLILFDFDGTIADSLLVLIKAFNRLAPEFGCPQVSLAQIPEIKNLSSREGLQKLAIPSWQMPFFLYRLRREVSRLALELQPIEGMPAVLIELHQRGHRLGIVTSNARSTVINFLDRQQLIQPFELIYAGQLLLGKARTLKRLVKRYQMDPKQVIYVGDETRDVEAARQAGLTMIAVSWGFNSATVLAKHQPDQLIDQPEQLLAVLDLHFYSN